jgi:hypothetical protein
VRRFNARSIWYAHKKSLSEHCILSCTVLCCYRALLYSYSTTLPHLPTTFTSPNLRESSVPSRLHALQYSCVPCLLASRNLTLTLTLLLQSLDSLPIALCGWSVMMVLDGLALAWPGLFSLASTAGPGLATGLAWPGLTCLALTLAWPWPGLAWPGLTLATVPEPWPDLALAWPDPSLALA